MAETPKGVEWIDIPLPMMACHLRGHTMPTTTTTDTPTIAVGDKLRVTDHDGGHGFHIGALVRVLEMDPHGAADSFLATTRDNDTSSWEHGVCAWLSSPKVERITDDVAPVEPVALVPGATYRVVDSARHRAGSPVYFPIGTLITPIGEALTDDEGEAYFETANGLRGYAKMSGLELVTDAPVDSEDDDTTKSDEAIDKLRKILAPSTTTWSVGDDVAVLWDGNTGPNGEGGCKLYLKGFQPGMRAKVEGLGDQVLQVMFESGSSRTVGVDQVGPFDTHAADLAAATLEAETAKALLVSRTQDLLDFQAKVKATVITRLDSLGLADQVDNLLGDLGLGSRFPDGFPRTRYSVVTLTDGNIAVRARSSSYNPWKIYAPTGGLTDDGYSVTEYDIAKRFAATIYTGPAS